MTAAPNLTNETLDDVAARALASIILERTADALHESGANAADALFNLHTDTGLVLDVCAAILFATTGIAGPAHVPADQVYAMSLAMAEGASDEVDPGELDDDDTAVPGVTHDAPDDDDGAEDALKVAREAMVAAAAKELSPMVTLPEREEPWVCRSCDCPALGLVNDVPVCFYHWDHTGDDPDCPSCHAWTPPVAPAPKPTRKSVKA